MEVTMKAILITAENRNAIANQYLIDGEDAFEMLPAGFWLIAPFGDGSQIDGVVSDAFFAANYQIEATIGNGYLAVSRIGLA